MTVYDTVGGDEFFIALVDHFYAEVEGNELLRPMYPHDLAGARERLTLFLIQYWGGPGTYSERRGHPRLRMRHGPFHVDTSARDAWLRCMFSALAAMDPPVEVGDAMRDYFTTTADFMRNVSDRRGVAPDAFGKLS